MKKLVLILCFLLFGCAPNLIIVDSQTGKNIPTPYLMQTLDSHINVVSFWTTYKSQTDIDGATIYKSSYISLDENHVFYKEIISCATCTILVKNPKKVEYQLIENITFVANNGKQTNQQRYIGKSNLDLRDYSFKLPFIDNFTGTIIYGIDLVEDGGVTIHFGDLKYRYIGLKKQKK